MKCTAQRIQHDSEHLSGQDHIIVTVMIRCQGAHVQMVEVMKLSYADRYKINEVQNWKY